MTGRYDAEGGLFQVKSRQFMAGVVQELTTAGSLSVGPSQGYRHRNQNANGSSGYGESFANGRRTIRVADVHGFWKLGVFVNAR